MSSKSSSDTVPPAVMPLVSPAALLQAHLQQNPPTRPSNRAPSQPRPIDLNTGSLTHCNGSAVVKIGQTTIVCGVRAEILPTSEIPHYRAPDLNANLSSQPVEDYQAVTLNNLLVPNLELSTGCHPLYPANTAPSTTAQSLSQRLLTLLHTSKIIPLSNLEIIYTPPAESQADLDPDDPAFVPQEPALKAYWVLYIDLLCISHGGSLFDAAWLALYAALKDTYLPKAWWDADEAQVLCSADVNEATRLDLRGMPVPLSFGVFEVQNKSVAGQQPQPPPQDSWVLLDIDTFEEECCDETGCVTVDFGGAEKGKILRMEKSGGGMLGADALSEVFPAAQKRWNEWRAVLSSRMLKASG